MNSPLECSVGTCRLKTEGPEAIMLSGSSQSLTKVLGVGTLIGSQSLSCGNLWEQRRLKAPGLEHLSVKGEAFGGPLQVLRYCVPTLLK